MDLVHNTNFNIVQPFARCFLLREIKDELMPCQDWEQTPSLGGCTAVINHITRHRLTTNWNWLDLGKIYWVFLVSLIICKSEFWWDSCCWTWAGTLSNSGEGAPVFKSWNIGELKFVLWTDWSWYVIHVSGNTCIHFQVINQTFREWLLDFTP